jgi:diphthine methyl ester acylhydrolase
MGGPEEVPIASRQSLILDLPPSCVEFCLAHPSFFVVGTYNLVKEEQATDSANPADDENDQDDVGDEQQGSKKLQNRNGSLVVFQMRDGQA